jgi:archaellum biogenesis ATPase FlaH
MAAKTIITPVLKFWGFERHPFDDLVLRGDELDLFIDRKVELRRLQNSLSHSLCGVFGTQGVGKSSVLNRLVVLTLKEGYAVAMVQMTGTSENLLYREILAAILREIKAGNVKVAAKLGLKVDQELERVQSSIKYTSSVETSGEAGWKALLNLAAKTGIKKQEEREVAKHTEDTAVEMIRDIAQHKKEPFVVVIDNLERAKYMLNSEEAYFRFITKFAQTVDTTFAELGVPFVVSLDQSFPDRIDGYLPGAEEAYSFAFGQLVEIGVFPPGDFFKIVNRRLSHRGWPGKVDDFIEQEAFWALMIATGGHPRRAFAVLREVMELIASENGAKKIRLKQIRAAIDGCGEKLTDTDMQIFRFLAVNGPHSSSDDAFMKAVGIGRAQLRTRLTELQKKALLSVTEETSGSAKKDVYSLDRLDLS